MTVPDADTLLRAREWVFHFARGNVVEAVAVEQTGPPLRPSEVMAAVMWLLADEQLMLVPMGDPSADEPQEVPNECRSLSRLKRRPTIGR